MTKIKILGNHIIFDGHADTKHECETITLMCDNLAKSIDFKTIKYESGYAEFERIGGTNDLMFAPVESNLTINFDSNITQVIVNTAGGTITCTESGSAYDSMTYNFSSTSTPPTFTVTLNSGYIIDTITVSDNDAGGTVTKTSDSTFTGSNICTTGDCTIAITSKQGGTSKQTIDVSTLSGWEALASGDHSITVKTKASGYADSASSNAVTVSKVVTGGYTVTFNSVFMYNSGNKIKINGVEEEFDVAGETKVFNNVKTLNIYSSTAMTDLSSGTGSFPTSYNWSSGWGWDTDLEITQDSSCSIGNDN